MQNIKRIIAAIITLFFLTISQLGITQINYEVYGYSINGECPKNSGPSTLGKSKFTRLSLSISESQKAISIKQTGLKKEGLIYYAGKKSKAHDSWRRCDFKIININAIDSSIICYELTDEYLDTLHIVIYKNRPAFGIKFMLNMYRVYSGQGIRIRQAR